MSLDDVFREANKRREAIAREEGQHSGEENANRTAELAERQKVAKLIDTWLRQAHNRLTAAHYAALQSNGYDLQHQYELTPTVPGQTYSALTLFLQRGGVVHVFGADRLGYKADHRLELTGDEKSGQITARFVSAIANTNEEIRSFDAEQPPDHNEIDSLFEGFLKRSMELEDWRRTQTK